MANVVEMRASRIRAGRCYPLEECPPIDYDVRYLLKGRDPTGRTVVVGTGRAQHVNPIINLHFALQRGGSLGASEILLIS